MGRFSFSLSIFESTASRATEELFPHALDSGIGREAEINGVTIIMLTVGCMTHLIRLRWITILLRSASDDEILVKAKFETRDFPLEVQRHWLRSWWWGIVFRSPVTCQSIGIDKSRGAVANVDV